MSEPEGRLTHLDAEGRARMVDVSDKAVTTRVAVATGRMETTPEVIALIRADNLPKADVLATARVAGIQGAKRTSELIPMAHPIPITSVKVEFGFTDTAVTITARAKTVGVTGIEMEALTAVAVAGLTLHDMVKAVDPGAVMTDVRLEEKTGGRHGHWTRAGIVPDAPVAPGQARVIVASTSAAAGTKADLTGPVIVEWLRANGFETPDAAIVADASIATGLADALAERPGVILTTGGTGLTPDDRTADATEALLDQRLDGVADAIRARGLTKTPNAAMSRAVAGVAKGTIIVNLPGSPGAVSDGLAVLEPILGHLINQLQGKHKHESDGAR